MLTCLDNKFYALRVEGNERSKNQYKLSGRSNYRNRNWSTDSSRDSQDRDRRPTRRSNGKKDVETNLEIIQVIDQMIEQEKLRMIPE